MAQLTYRPWREGDDRTLLQLWGDAEGASPAQFRGAFAPDSDGADDAAPSPAAAWRRCIVAEDQGIPVAAGVVYEAALHPARLWVYVEVARDHRRAGIGTELLQRLRGCTADVPARIAEAAGGGAPRLRSKVEAGSAGAAFAEARGFGLLQRSREVVVRPGALKLPVFGDSPAADTGLGDDTSPLVEDLATGSVELSDAVGRYYMAVHEWDPPAPLSVGRAQQLFLSDAAGAHGAVVLRAPAGSAFGAGVTPSKKGRLRAFAVSYAGPSSAAAEQPSEVLLGHEVRLDPADAEDAVRGLLALVAYQHPVRLEVDDAMGAVRAAIDPLLEAGAAEQVGPETLTVGD
ncbi:GNAT superfamily N-acetyltransferase [Sinomonas atrocyanea]|uniref:GNAT family N-acetyltransferase n=1 Tax=Sinomonas atrocyanea TaxID=37927 RepID=UPI002785D9EE|nr:GNAT family N-acetyltransferase [Sinomonas atrocyanea]MDP9883455.1 GNAT superfamily N-acetyltransferase [Sinomonas atrocyanea]